MPATLPSLSLPLTPMGSCSLDTTTAFTPTPSCSSGMQTMWAPVCPLSSGKCSVEPHHLAHHLCHKHKAAHYAVQLDEEGTANIDFDTVIPKKDGLLRRTAVVLTLSDTTILSWTVETRRRADGETQASGVIQMIQAPVKTPSRSQLSSKSSVGSSPTNSNNNNNVARTLMRDGSVVVDDGESSSTTSSFRTSMDVNPGLFMDEELAAIAGKHRERRGSNGSIASGDFNNFPILLDDNHEQNNGDEVVYKATITVPRAADKEEMIWQGILHPDSFCQYHSRQISHGHGLVAMWPSHADVFRETKHRSATGEMEAALGIVMNLHLQKIGGK